MIALREQLSGSMRVKYDSLIYKHAVDLKQYKSAEGIFLYSSSPQEADTAAIFADAVSKGKRIAFPRVTGDGTMEFYEVSDPAQLTEGYKGILEPDSTCPVADFVPGVIFVPGVAFDRSFMRMGYGKGFYDRYFEAHSDRLGTAVLAALAYSLQLRGEIPSQPHDRRMDIIITEEEIWTRETDS